MDIGAWAWESHEVAERIVYGNLPAQVAIEKPEPVTTCAEDDHISTRMLKLNEQIGHKYDEAAVPAIEEQLAKAGARLAAALDSVWPGMATLIAPRSPPFQSMLTRLC